MKAKLIIRLVVAEAMVLCAAYANAAGGWYLMEPPIDHDHGKALYEAPIAYWTQEGSFDSATQCEKGLSENFQWFARAKPLSEKQQERSEADFDAMMKWAPGTMRKSRGMGQAAALAARCIASDDPRLAK